MPDYYTEILTIGKEMYPRRRKLEHHMICADEPKQTRPLSLLYICPNCGITWAQQFADTTTIPPHWPIPRWQTEMEPCRKCGGSGFLDLEGLTEPTDRYPDAITDKNLLTYEFLALLKEREE